METKDIYSLILTGVGLVFSLLAYKRSNYALEETRRQNAIAIHEKRYDLYKEMKQTVTDVALAKSFSEADDAITTFFYQCQLADIYFTDEIVERLDQLSKLLMGFVSCYSEYEDLEKTDAEYAQKRKFFLDSRRIIFRVSEPLFIDLKDSLRIFPRSESLSKKLIVRIKRLFR
ncbi:hypothetical protein LG202_08930 [Methylobacillus methanolivorans]